jgi:hypothetical protein
MAITSKQSKYWVQESGKNENLLPGNIIHLFGIFENISGNGWLYAIIAIKYLLCWSYPAVILFHIA